MIGRRTLLKTFVAAFTAAAHRRRFAKAWGDSDSDGYRQLRRVAPATQFVATPIVFDEALILTPLLFGELHPLVTTKVIRR